MSDAVTVNNCMMLRHINPECRIYAELLHPRHRSCLEAAGANRIIGVGQIGVSY